MSGVPRPLDPQSAAERVAQIRVLAEPDRLRIMSLLAIDASALHGVSSIAEALDADAASIRSHLELLAEVRLVESRPGSGEPCYLPTADAWVRFGRLLSGKSAYRESGSSLPPAELDTLPPQVGRIAERLAYRYSAHFSSETVERYVAESYRLLRSRARTTRHIVSLTSRFATDRLGALAAARGFDLTGVPEVLFVCVQNAGRSQLAAGILRSIGGDRVHVRTAGSRPAERIDPVIEEALAEIGVSTVAEFPKPLTDEVVQAADVVITMGCGDACPVYPGRRYMDWKIADPVGADLAAVRRIRDEVASHVRQLAVGLGLA
jgi:protein-tyrosine-phosphatase/DNA-binding transcriptional ArsR family regulator